MAPRKRSSSEDEIDEEYLESYFKTYVPLERLPTPPLCSTTSTRQQSPEILFPGETFDPQLLGPAVHLKNLIPTSTSLTEPSIPLIQSILAHANLPLETVALAVCILDSLNSRFAHAYRHACPLTPPPLTPSNALYIQQIPHLDNIHPELLILSALILAVKFLEDAQEPISKYAREWGKDIWTCEQINWAEKCILENIGHRLLPLWEESVIQEALSDMRRAGEQFEPRIYVDEYEWERGQKENLRLEIGGKGERGMSSGKAVLGLGEQMTPAETPMVEEGKELSLEAQAAYAGNGRKEPFPMYVDPGIERLVI